LRCDLGAADPAKTGNLGIKVGKLTEYGDLLEYRPD
jgi:hypothetical protein